MENALMKSNDRVSYYLLISLWSIFQKLKFGVLAIIHLARFSGTMNHVLLVRSSTLSEIQVLIKNQR